MLAIGAAHGLAGTGSVVLLIPVAFAEQWIAAIAFLILFGIGTMIAMGMFSWLFSLAVTTPSSERVVRSFRLTAGLASLVVGILWISEHLL